MFFEFLADQWVLVAALAICCALLVFYERQRSGVRVTPHQLVQLINHGQAVVLDVRGEREFAAGHILNARHVPAGEVVKQIERLKKYRDKPVIVVCDAGNKSVTVVRTLAANGFSKVSRLKGGLMEWRQAQLPLVS